MTFADTTFATPRFILPLRGTLSSLCNRRRTSSAIAHLDDRLRADVGLPPSGERTLLPLEAAARAAMMAWR
jgi:uncharacterized protein YjiS (DUF1127 family)